MHNWVADLLQAADAGRPLCLVTVVAVRGSAPREPGARMIVSGTAAIGTIGGGQLEYQCAAIAARLLAAASDQPEHRRFPLGSGCGQCCGGVVDVLFEPGVDADRNWLGQLRDLYGDRCPFVTTTDKHGQRRIDGNAEMSGDCSWDARELAFRQRISPTARNVAVFGAGHVGSALVAALLPLGCEIRWIDSRRSVFPDTLPANVTPVSVASPALEVAAMPAGSSFLVMTHSHPLDFEITDAILRRGDSAYCGLIGSASKRRRFERLMRKQGMRPAQLELLVCPIGVAGIDGKRPQEIAVAVAAQLLERWSAAAAASPVSSSTVRAL